MGGYQLDETKHYFYFCNQPQACSDCDHMEGEDYHRYNAIGDTVTFTNRRDKVETITLSGAKTWDDDNNQDGKGPDSITVKLYADGEDTGRELVLEQKNNWTGSFDNLDEYADGVKIVYTITEIKVDGYDTAISGNAETGFVISNSHTPATPDEPQNPGQPEKPVPPKGDAPQTGDTTDPALWLALLAISSIGLVATQVLWRKKRSRGRYMK